MLTIYFWRYIHSRARFFLGALFLMFAFSSVVLAAIPAEHNEEGHDESGEDDIPLPRACKKASAQQLAQENQGLRKLDAFLRDCQRETNNSRWCQEVARPNPASRSVFSCTYGANQPHILIHPNESTWVNAIAAVKLVEQLEKKNIKVARIYNWWRPEPYNKNVGGAAGRHPFGTSVDVRFGTLTDMEMAHAQLCAWRSQHKIRALGYYGSTGLHFGVADATANTWGKKCPND